MRLHIVIVSNMKGFNSMVLLRSFYQESYRPSVLAIIFVTVQHPKDYNAHAGVIIKLLKLLQKSLGVEELIKTAVSWLHM